MWAKRLLIALSAVFMVFVAISTEALDHFNRQHAGQPYEYGATFSAEYANYLGVDPKTTLTAILTDLHPTRLRLVSYWDQIEGKPGKYDFSKLDWQFELAKKYGAKVSLAVGLRQPRFPECHYPQWTKGQSEQMIYSELDPFIAAVVNHYKVRPELEDYQLENEALLTVFGKCMPFSRSQLVKEFNLVHQLDPGRPVAVNVSNEYGLPLRAPIGDEIGFSVYRRVFDSRITHRFVNYPFPTLWFKLRAAVIERYLGAKVFIHEQQAEPWGRTDTKTLTLAEQNEAFGVNNLRETASYARSTGIKRIDFWGAEWWYWRKVKFNDPSIWETAQAVFRSR